MMHHLLVVLMITATQGRQPSHHRVDLEEPIIPVLTDKQSAAINRFENHKIFAQVWKEAGRKLAEEMQEIREKKNMSLRRHRKHHSAKHHREEIYDSPDERFGYDDE